MISAIVAVDKNYGIGYQGKLLCPIKEDLKRFKQITTGSVVVMGRKTWDSLLNEPLPNRTNVIVTSNVDGMQMKNGVIYTTLELLEKCIVDISNKHDVFIIGGGQIYKELLPYCTHVYYLKIKSQDELNPKFLLEELNNTINNICRSSYEDFLEFSLEQKQNIKNDDNWELTLESDIITANKINYQFLIYKRKED